MRTQDELSKTFAHYAALRREMSLWVEQSIQRDGPDRHQGGEDEANYALAFFPQYLISGEERIVERFRSLVADLKHWVATEGHLGYEAEAEAHHGTEPFFVISTALFGPFSPRQRGGGAIAWCRAAYRQLGRGRARLVRLAARCFFELSNRQQNRRRGCCF